MRALSKQPLQLLDVVGGGARQFLGGPASTNKPSPKATKLVFFVSEDWYFWSHRLPLALAARDAGYDVTVVTRVHEHGTAISDLGLRVVPVRMTRRTRSPYAEFASVWEIVRIYRRLHPAIVHHVAVKPVVYGSIAARLAGISGVVNALAGLGWLFVSNSPKARFARRFLPHIFRVLLGPNPVIVQNPDDRSLLLKAGLEPKHVAVIRGSGVDLDRFAPTPESDEIPVVLLASRMLWDKGIGEFVDSARLLKARGIQSRFVLVGEPDPENPGAVPEAQLRDWNAEKVIEWWGRRIDMPTVFRHAHVVCLPSYGEGVPKVLIEAAACGRAIVTTDTPGCREIVRHGQNGLLVPARDIGALADAISYLARNPAVRRQMGAKGREFAASEFSLERVISETLAIYEKLVRA